MSSLPMRVIVIAPLWGSIPLTYTLPYLLTQIYLRGHGVSFRGERYTLNQPAKVVKHNSRHFEYTLTMDSEGANLKNYKFRNPNDKTLKFPSQHLLTTIYKYW